MKSFKVCMYDFRRLILNPITLCGFIIAIVACVIAGFCFSPTITPSLSLNLEYETADKLYQEFMNGNEEDSLTNLNLVMAENQSIIDGQRDTTLIDEYNSITEDVDTFLTNLELYLAYPDVYPDNFTDNSFDVNLQTNLNSFYEKISALEDFESPLYFTDDDMLIIEELSTLLNENISYSTSIATVRAMYDEILTSRQLVRDFLNIEVLNWQASADETVELELNYILNPTSKLRDILVEFEMVYRDTQNEQRLQDMESLALNYKRIATFANENIKNELILLLSDSIPNYQNYIGYVSQEEAELKQIVIANNYILRESDLYYTNYLSPMNFNSANGSVNAYDFAYYLISIIGFILVFIGIFFAYKLFGRDRSKGKIDVVLAQNTSFNSVFAGKFFAIMLATASLLLVFSVLILLTSYLIYGVTFTPILAVFNLSNAYVVNPLVYLLFKLIFVEVEVIFFALVTILLMNVSRKFDIMFGVSIGVYAVSFVMNIFLCGFFVYALFPFAHTNLFSYFGGANSGIGFLNTTFIAGGNFFISLCYILVLMLGLYFLTNQLFKRN